MFGFFIIFWVAIVALILWVPFRDRPDVRRQVSGVFSDLRSQADPAEEILRNRLARGEIDVEEYEKLLRVMKG